MMCELCQRENPPGSLYCRGCYNLFLNDDLPDGELPQGDSDRVIQLAQGCELLLSKHWTIQEFQQFLHEFTTEQRRREGEVTEVYQEIPFGLEEEFQEEYEAGYNGVVHINRALERLSIYHPENSSSLEVKRAVYEFFQGVCDVKEAMDINRRNRGRPLWI